VFAAVAAFDLHLPDCHSLKDKRTAVRPIVEGLQRRYRVAAAEVEHQDKWQRAGIAAAAVAGTESHVCDILDRVERFVWSFPEIEVLAVTRHWLDT
jgi:hypothetical protein